MGISTDQSKALFNEADRLRQGVQAHGSLLEIAAQLGLEVWLAGVPKQTSGPSGFLEYSSPPRITVRRVTQRSFTKRLAKVDDRQLWPRERFTLAHEIGHWLAYRQFGIGPATRPSEYWKDEAIVNQFASRLLVPDHQIDHWLSALSESQGIHVHQMIRWAHEIGASKEVVSVRLCEKRKGIGFLSLRTKPSRHKWFPDLHVSHSAGDPALCLPQRRRIVRSERLARRLGEASTDGDRLSAFAFGSDQRRPMTYHLSWVQIGDDRSAEAGETGYWTSWSIESFGRRADFNSMELPLRPASKLPTT